MSKELATLADEQNLAVSLSKGDMLPESYRNKPANVLIAIGLGRSMGLSPAESLYRIAVIKGKPTASAELIASKVREAGHRLRITVGPDWAEATILRADDPEFPFIVRRDVAWAQQMGLASNDNYKKQLVTMLQWRAVSACARMACPEALYGVAYTPEEMTDGDGAVPVSATNLTPVTVDAVEVETVEAEVVEAPEDRPVTTQQKAALKGQIDRLGMGAEEYLARASEIAGRDITGTAFLSEQEADYLLAELANIPDTTEPSATTAKAALKAARDQQGQLGETA